jgi:hypothetical protein
MIFAVKPNKQSFEKVTETKLPALIANANSLLENKQDLYQGIRETIKDYESNISLQLLRPVN